MSDINKSLDGMKTEGDINLSPHRGKWSKDNIDAMTRRTLDEDAKALLHQSLSTPCLNVIKSASGSSFQDSAGRSYLDFHGNNVHNVGFSHPRVVAAIKRQLDELSFCTRRYTCEPAIALAEKLIKIAPDGLDRVLLAPGGTIAIGDGAQAGARGDRAFQICFDVGLVSWRFAGCDFRRGRSGFPQGHRPAVAGLRARSARGQSPLPV